MVVSEGHNRDNEGASLQLYVKATNGKWNEVFIARKDLTKSDVQGRLVSAGLLPGDWKIIQHVLQNIDPPDKFFSLERAGWTDDYYATPGGDVLPDDGKARATFTPVPDFDVGGTLEGARALLATVEGQTKLVFAICAALSAPFLKDFGPDAEPGAFHFHGTSSHGKTTMLVLASSVWGRGAEKKDGGIVMSWAITRFAAERMAERHSDCAMFMDELKSADPDQFAHLALQITNGAGKMAGTQTGALRDEVVFRPLVLSTGEVSAKQYITSNRLHYHAGMAVRFLDIAADSTDGHGIFDTVPEGVDDAGAFARQIKKSAAENYGHLGRLFVQAYLDDRDAMLADIRHAWTDLRVALAAKNVHADPQINRVIGRFALVGAVGIVGCDRGLLPWTQESVRHAVTSVFDVWLAGRGGQGSQEGLAAEEAFNSFVFTQSHRLSQTSERNRVGVRRWTEELHQEIWVSDEKALIEMLGQPERVGPFLKRLADEQSDEWEHVKGKDEKGELTRNRRDAPSGYGLPKRSYCFRKKYPEPEEAAKDPVRTQV